MPLQIQTLREYKPGITVQGCFAFLTCKRKRKEHPDLGNSETKNALPGTIWLARETFTSK